MCRTEACTLSCGAHSWKLCVWKTHETQRKKKDRIIILRRTLACLNLLRLLTPHDVDLKRICEHCRAHQETPFNRRYGIRKAVQVQENPVRGLRWQNEKTRVQRVRGRWKSILNDFTGANQSVFGSRKRTCRAKRDGKTVRTAPLEHKNRQRACWRRPSVLFGSIQGGIGGLSKNTY